MDIENIFVVHSDMFSKKAMFACKSGTSNKAVEYVLQKSPDKTDPGHSLFVLMPSQKVAKGVKALDCDAKSDNNMEHVALNCFPVERNSSEHK